MKRFFVYTSHFAHRISTISELTLCTIIFRKVITNYLKNTQNTRGDQMTIVRTNDDNYNLGNHVFYSIHAFTVIYQNVSH